MLRLLEGRHPIIGLISEYREMTKLDSTYLAALPELVTTTDLLAIVPQSYARSMASRWPVCVRALPGDAPQYDVRWRSMRSAWLA